MSLKEYHRKRNFKKTKEPRGEKKRSNTTNFIYVIQKHAASHLHYDLRLELEGVLLSWAVPKGPSLDPQVKHLAMHVEDHPIDYANFEGIIPPGEYGGGTVMVWDIGRWEPLDINVHQAYHKGDLTFNLHGKKLRGLWKLIKIRQQAERKEQWLLFKVRDEYSRSEQDYDIKKSAPYSALTGRSLEQIANEKQRVWTRQGEVNRDAPKKRLTLNIKKLPGAAKQPLPGIISPELATLVTEPPSGENWLHEIKWDGYRLIARVRGNLVALLTRHHNDWTHHFPAIAKALKSLRLKDSILDGEVIALDAKGKANFQRLQNSMENTHLQATFIYYIFDLLYWDGFSVVAVPLIKRKELLKKILDSKTLPAEIRFNDHIIGNGESVYKNACQYSLEGIVSKRIDSHYLEKRTKQWLKIKCIQRQEFVVGGYTYPQKSRQYFRSLLLGYYYNGKLIYCGKVGTGFSQETLREVAQMLAKYQQDTCPFESMPGGIRRDMRWLIPKLVAEIEFLEITSDGVLRHPSFKGLREDKKAEEVTLEFPAELSEVAIMANKKRRPKKSVANEFSNLNRVLYPEQGLTKRDLIGYYESVADWILPYIVNRPLSLVRCPSGDHRNCFYQKHVNETVPSVIKAIPVWEHGHYEPYISIDSLDGLLGLVQVGVLEIHPWGSTRKNVEKPDWMVFDLDPGPEVSWTEVIECANQMKQFFDLLKLESFIKTTGGKGLHIVVPIKPRLGWDQVHDISKRIADIMVEINPNKYIATMSKAKRIGKIFIDYVRNTRGATAIAPYSTRAKAHAPVAVPIAWEELATDLRSDSFTVLNIKNRLARLKIDPWADFFKIKQSITVKIKRELGMK